MSTKLLNEDTFALLPDSVKSFLELVQHVSDSATAKTKKNIKTKLEKVNGFIEIPEKKKEIGDQFAQALVKNADMKVIAARCEEIMQSGALPRVEKNNGQIKISSCFHMTIYIDIVIRSYMDNHN